MLFNSFEYAISLPMVLVLYQNILIFFVGHILHGWWVLIFLGITALSVMLEYFVARLNGDASDHKKKKTLHTPHPGIFPKLHLMKSVTALRDPAMFTYPVSCFFDERDQLRLPYRVKNSIRCAKELIENSQRGEGRTANQKMLSVLKPDGPLPSDKTIQC
jgi:hypothetical protein